MIEVDVRLIAATHRDLETMLSDGDFREDLYYRINVFPIHIPPLRERKEDIPTLANYAATKARSRVGLPQADITDAAMERLLDYSWPGNVRELENVMERAVILSRGDAIDRQHVLIGPALGVPTPQSKPPRPQGMRETEKAHIMKALERAKWQIEGSGGAAELLELNASTLRSRMKKLGIVRPGS
jgi:transcriptional regulator with GAF, ATPase, and Fis domain